MRHKCAITTNTYTRFIKLARPVCSCHEATDIYRILVFEKYNNFLKKEYCENAIDALIKRGCL